LPPATPPSLETRDGGQPPLAFRARGHFCRLPSLPHSKRENGDHPPPPPSRVSSKGTFLPSATPPSLEMRDGGQPPPSLSRFEQGAFSLETWVGGLPSPVLHLAFRATEGFVHAHQAVPRSKHESEGLFTPTCSLTRVSSDGGLCSRPPSPPSLETQVGGFFLCPPSRVLSNGALFMPTPFPRSKRESGGFLPMPTLCPAF